MNRSNDSYRGLNLDKLSLEALEKIAKVLKVLVVRIETNPHSPGIKLPLRLFENLNYVEVVDVLQLLGGNGNLFAVLNDYLKKLDREIDVEISTGRALNPKTNGDFGTKINIERDVYFRLGFIQEDMKESILLEVKELSLASKLTRLQKQVERGIKKTKKQEPLVGSILPNGLLKYKSDGDTTYTSISGKKYQAKFGKGSNPNRLLLYLTKDIHKSAYKFDEFEEVLRKPRSGGEGSGNERRVRDTVQSIRTKMGLPRGEMIVIDNDVKIKCGIQINS